ncbi:MAG: S1C family serine protease [Oscillospiraceae bacterium]
MEYYSTQNFDPEPSKPPKKKHGAGYVMALIAAVALVGGGAGFGGAFIANRANSSALIGGESSVSESAASSAANSEISGSAGSADSGSSNGSEVTSTPTLSDLQAGAVVHNVTTNVEYNTDGTFMYTRDLVASVRDSIVYIEVYVDYRGQQTLYGSGSGIIISSDGYVLTNAHVTDKMDAFKVQVTTTDPTTGTGVTEKFDAQLIGSDTDTDLAVLKIDADNLQPAVLGNSDDVHLGDDCVVIGNPLGLETSVTKGVVSGLNRQISSNERSLSSIQTDAAINSGNSGGAMFNMYGEVIGVVNEKLVNDYAENVGFAITINEAKTVIDDLISKGYVTGRPILGITCLQVSEYIGAIQGMTPGLYVTDIDQSLAIAQSGLVVGDTITAIDGVSVTTTAEVSSVLNGKKPGDTVTATVVRTDSLGRNKEVEIEIILSEYNGS